MTVSSQRYREGVVAGNFPRDMTLVVLYLTLMVTVLLQEEVAPLAGAAAAHHGHGSLVLVIAACALGSWAGDVALFAIGRRGGGLARRARLGPSLAWIARHPVAAPFVVRFSIGARFTLALACGAARVSVRRFLVWDAVSAVAWATAYAALGWAAGEAAERVFTGVRHHELVAITALTALWLAVFVGLHLRARPRAAEAV